MPFQTGGEAHSDWLPPGAAIPLPTPVENVVLDVEIRFDGSGYFLCYESRDGSVCGDDWFATLESAELIAAERFGIAANQWETGGDDAS